MFMLVQMERRTTEVMTAYRTSSDGAASDQGPFQFLRTALPGYNGITVIGIVVFLLSDALKVMFEVALGSD